MNGRYHITYWPYEQVNDDSRFSSRGTPVSRKRNCFVRVARTLSPGTTNFFFEIYSSALNVKSKYSTVALAIEFFYFDLALSFRQTERIRSVLRRRLTHNRDGTPGIRINSLFVILSKLDGGYFWTSEEYNRVEKEAFVRVKESRILFALPVPVTRASKNGTRS